MCTRAGRFILRAKAMVFLVPWTFVWSAASSEGLNVTRPEQLSTRSMSAAISAARSSR